ncbi:MAG: ABC transporter ATP-binding protein, partial [SAR324 cluster bacterium]|nr:ABC transporter ATP-binding protein [SAR324 cluster bacterium]
LSKSVYHNAINLKISVKPNQNVQQILLGIPSVERVEIQSSNHQTLSFVILAKQGKPILEEVKERLDQQNVKIVEMYVEKGRLDEVFRQMTIVEAA